MRLNYTDDEDYPGQFDLWQANCRRSLRGKAGQAALKRLEAALVALPEKRLISGRLVDNAANVCAIGALAKAEGILPDPEPSDDWDTEDYWDEDEDAADFAAERLGFPRLVAWKVVEQNDIILDTVWEVAYGPLRPHEAHYKGGLSVVRDMTPEERYGKMLAWVRANIIKEPR